MVYRLLADGVVIIHLGFVLFAIAGGLLVFRWRTVLVAHLAAVVWAVVVELFGFICPLTPLENQLRKMAGQEGYEGDFLGRYLMPVLYPEGLNRGTQIWLGLAVLALNVIVYAFLWKRLKQDET